MTDVAEPSVSVVIPTLNAGSWLGPLLTALDGQSVRLLEIILVDSGSTDDTLATAAGHPLVRVVPITNFSHGGARNLGAREARGELVALLTQDASPADASWLARLIEVVREEGVVAAYSRQTPRPDANPMEQFFLADRFPAGSTVYRRARPGQTLLIEDVFFSNVAALVRRDILLRFPFDEELIMSEDQQFARDVLQAGYAVAYVPASVVVHSHNYTLGVCLRRYFDSIYSLRTLFHGHDFGTTWRMGWSYQWREWRFMVTRYPGWIPYYLAYNGAKIAGTLAAHVAEHLPRRWARRISLHRYYWT